MRIVSISTIEFTISMRLVENLVMIEFIPITIRMLFNSQCVECKFVLIPSKRWNKKTFDEKEEQSRQEEGKEGSV